MRCGYWEAGVCRSCTLIEQPYVAQLAGKQALVEQALASVAGRDQMAWSEPAASRESRFRNKAKLVVSGTVVAPTLGILDPAGAGVDLRSCGLHEQVITAALGPLAGLVTRAGLTPYDVPARRGELKHLLITASPDDELMVRFVLRTEEALPRLRKHMGWLREQLPQLRVVTANLQPEHKAVLEGPREIVLGQSVLGLPETGETLPMRLAGMELLLRPQSFFQTNTAVAEQLYEQARAWVEEAQPRSLWDLYCGVGGFALACAAPGREVLGVEQSEAAVAGARTAATRSGAAAEFAVGDAAAYVRERPAPDLVVVNPPRRGIGELAVWLEASGVERVLYSSCNVESLVRDLTLMPSLRPVRARLFDMFPQTRHHEVLVLLERVSPTSSAARRSPRG